MNQRQVFLNHVGQTSPNPLLLEIEKAEGIFFYDTEGKRYFDMVSGVSVSNLGHNNNNVVKAIKDQVDKYMHVMVYGEFIQSPQVQLARALSRVLPAGLNCTYFVNSGSEATEGALKLAKRYTGRYNVVAFKNAYHGSTIGSLSVMGGDYYKQGYRPLVPGVTFLDFDDSTQLDAITSNTACVIIEPVQGEAGIRIPTKSFMRALRERCDETGALLVYDEIQTGFGRLGHMFAMDYFEVIPDIVTLAKGLGGGMPLGAFVSRKEVMDSFMSNPVLGHITTFGGHPVCCAAALASLEELINHRHLIEDANRKKNIFVERLKHEKIITSRGMGLFLAIELDSEETVFQFISKGARMGIVTDPFLFDTKCIRIAPPLVITDDEIEESCELILKILDTL